MFKKGFKEMLLYNIKYLMSYNKIMPSKTAKRKEINLNVKATKQLRPQLLDYLDSVSKKIHGKSYSTIRNIFINSNKTKLIKTYEDLKKQVEQYTPASQKISMRTIKPLPQKDYLINVVFYSDTGFSGGKKGAQKKWKDLYVMFPKEPHRQLHVKAPKVFPVHLTKQVIRSDSKKQLRFFRAGITIFLTDDEFKDLYDKKGHYITAFKIFTVDSIDTSKSQHKPLEKKLKSGEKVSINNKYIETTVDTSFDTFVEAIAKKNHVRNECWINTLVDVYGDTLMSNRKREVVNREKILEIIGKTEESIKEGISVKDVQPFFEKYRLQLRVFDEYMRLLFKYDHDSPSHHHKVLYCMVKGDHVYTLNNNLKELQQKAGEDKMIVKASDNYFIKEEQPLTVFKMIDGVDDIVQIIREYDYEEVEVRLIHRHNNLTDLVYSLMNTGIKEYEPTIKYDAGHLTRLELTLNKIRFTIESQQLVKDSLDGDISVETEGIYNKMNQAMVTFNRSLIKPAWKSHYSKTDLEVLDEYRTTVPIGRLTLMKDVESMIEIDISKAFTSAFLKISEVPVFNEFDYFRPYDNQPIKNYCLYIVKASKPSLFFNKTHNIVYGMFLNGFLSEVEILAFKAPSFMKEINTQDIIETLWKIEISPDPEEDKAIKKLIANVNFGLLEKSTNKAQLSNIYETLDEAKLHQEQYGGRISILSKFTEAFEIDDHDVGTDNPPLTSVWKEEEKRYYILNRSDKAQLKNGFRYIKELLLQHHNFKMFSDYSTLRGHGIEVFSVKSDALTIRKEDLDKARSLITFSLGIGGWRVSKEDEINFPLEGFRQIKNEEVTIEVPSFERVHIKDEYDTDELCRVFEKYKRVVVRGSMPGCGKSYACEKMKERGHKVLFVCPTNKLVQKYGCEGITMNRFFSMGVDQDTVMSKFDSSDYDVIVFDEVYLSCIKKLTKIKQYCDSHPEKIIIATGDTKQLEPIEKLSNQIDYDEYADHCVNAIFNYEIFLEIPKRVKSDEDKLKLKQLKEDIFNEEIPLMQTITKYFRFTKDKTRSNKNIAYLNKTCASVAKEIRGKLNKTGEYEVGEKLICRNWFKVNKDSFNVNFEYEIVGVDNNNITITDISTKINYVLNINKIRTNFIFSYCGTCHSYQGSSLKESMTIFDYKYHFVDRKWLWTAITRATDLNNVWFYDYSEKPLNTKMFNSYFHKKVEGYRAQDRRANRTISENYVTAEWLQNCINKPCRECGCTLEIEFDSGFATSNITAQRLDNSKDHNLDNVVPMCVRCNCALSNKF